jgi:hypothetical protein
MDERRAVKIFAASMQKAVLEAEAQQAEEARQAARRERARRAYRQFLLFLLFAAIAAAAMYRKELGVLVNRGSASVPDASHAAASDPRVRAKDVAKQKLQAVADEAERRNAAMDDMRK